MAALAAVIVALLLVAPTSAGAADSVVSPALAEVTGRGAQPTTGTSSATPAPPAPAPPAESTEPPAASPVSPEPAPAESAPAQEAASSSPIPSSAVEAGTRDATPTETAMAVVKRVASTDSLGGGAPEPPAIANSVPGIDHSAAGEITRGTTRNLVALGVGIADRLAADLIDPALRPAGLFDSFAPTNGAAENRAQWSPAPGEPSSKAPSSLPKLTAAGSLSVERTIAAGPSADAFQLKPSGIEPGGVRSPKAGKTALSPGIGIPSASPAGATAGDRGGRAPANVPLPEPGSPANAVADSGGTSFVPIVALLALLALVAPTALRRLGKAPDFRAPTPFVCALERPG